MIQQDFVLLDAESSAEIGLTMHALFQTTVIFRFFDVKLT